jgi:hypothetical protein
MLKLPPLMSSSPAMTRNKVDLPQADGPTKTMNSPSWISRSISRRTGVTPNDFCTPTSLTAAIHCSFNSQRTLPGISALHLKNPQ